MLSLNDDVVEEYLLYGIQTPMVDEAKFVFLMNNQFNWRLRRIEDLDITFGKETYCFSSYLYEIPHHEEDYIYLITNRSHDLTTTQVHDSLFDDASMAKSRPLLHKYSQYQYLIKFPPDIDSTQIKNLTLTSIEFVYHIQLINNITRKESKYFLI